MNRPPCHGQQPHSGVPYYILECARCRYKLDCKERTDNMNEPVKPCPGCGKYRISDKAALCYNCTNGITHVPLGENIGFKQDSAKHRWSLLPSYPIAQVIKVLEFGAAKYKVNDWMHVQDARTRYYDAAMRHVEAWWTGEKYDTESGLHHLAHAACCLLFLIWFDKDAD